jgi:very-short-patch-repair endonuclease
VLRQLAEDPQALPRLAQRALRICHYDPETLEDAAPDTCGRACYECLLDYANQLDHKDLDRSTIRDQLAALAGSVCRPAGGVGSREERLAALRKRCDSKLEERWLDMIERHGLRVPSDAQYKVPNLYTQPDFYYREGHAAIYVDGPPHDTPDQVREDDKITRKLKQNGYIVVRFRHEDDWLEIVRKHPDLFGVPKS